MRTAQDPWDKPRRNPWPIVLACSAFVLAIVLALTVSALTLNFIFDALLEDRPTEAVTTPSPEPTSIPPPTAPAETPEQVRHREDIVSEGRLLAYDLQEIMQDQCERYGVPSFLNLIVKGGGPLGENTRPASRAPVAVGGGLSFPLSEP